MDLPSSAAAILKTGANPTTARSSPVPLFVGAIGAAEVVLVFGNLALGTALEAIVLAMILSFQATRAGAADGRAIAPLALVPLLRLLSLTVSLPGVAYVYWTGLVGVPLAVGAVLAARASGLDLPALGLRRTSWWPQAVIALTGLPAGFIIWRTAQPPSFVADGATAAEIVAVIIMLVLFVGFLEEFVFRGVIQAALSTHLARGAVVPGSILYATSYLGSLSLEYAVAMGAMGLLYGWLVQRTGSIVGVSLSHAILVVGALVAWPAWSP